MNVHIEKIGEYVVSIDHVAIAVKNLDKAIKFYSQVLGFTVEERRATEGKFSGMISATMKLGGVIFVLVEGTCEESNVCQYIKNYGPGVQHLAVNVKNIKKVYKILKGGDLQFLSGIIHSSGLDQIFTMRDENSGMMLEIIERNNAPSDFSNDNINKLFESMEAEGAY